MKQPIDLYWGNLLTSWLLWYEQILTYVMIYHIQVTLSNDLEADKYFHFSFCMF